MTSSHDDAACQIRYRDVPARLDELSARVDRLERDHRAFLRLLRDMHELIGVVAAFVKTRDRRIADIGAHLIPFQALRDPTTRHFRS